MPTYNRARTLEAALASVLNQTYRNIEVLIVDNGSTDNTVQVVKSLRDERLMYVRQKANTGSADARNFGVSLAKGELIAFQDSDDVWYRDKLEKQVDTIESLPASYGMVYSYMMTCTPEGEALLWKPAPQGKQKLSLFDRMLRGAAAGIGIQSCLLRRECFDKGALFDTNLKRLIDREFFIRLSQHFDMYELPIPLVTYIISEDSISRRTLNGIEAQKYIMEKYGSYLMRDRRALAYQQFILGKMFVAHQDYRRAGAAFRTAVRFSPAPSHLLWALVVHRNGRLYNTARQAKRKAHRVRQRVAKALS